MNNLEVRTSIETAMDLILDGKPDSALAVMWVAHRGLREMAMAELPALPAGVTPSRFETVDARAERLEKDRERKRLKRQGGELEALPAIKPINGMVTPTKTAEVTCPLCHAKPGHRCFRMTNPGRYSKVDPTRTIATYHQRRTDEARRITDKRQREAERLVMEATLQAAVNEAEARIES
jgi:hypothetical protein